MPRRLWPPRGRRPARRWRPARTCWESRRAHITGGPARPGPAHPFLLPRGDALVDVADGAQHALAGVAFRIAIAQLQRFVHASRGARRDRGPADTSVVQADVDFDGRVAP